MNDSLKRGKRKVQNITPYSPTPPYGRVVATVLRLSSVFASTLDSQKRLSGSLKMYKICSLINHRAYARSLTSICYVFEES